MSDTTFEIIEEVLDAIQESAPERTAALAADELLTECTNF